MIDNFYEKLNAHNLTTKFLVKAVPKNMVEGLEVLTCILDSLDDVLSFFKLLKEVSDSPNNLHLFVNGEEVEIETANFKSTDSVKFEGIKSCYKIEEIITSANYNYVKEF
jgi:hypothetical protein